MLHWHFLKGTFDNVTSIIYFTGEKDYMRFESYISYLELGKFAYSL